MTQPDPTDFASRQLDGLDAPIEVAFVGDDAALAEMYQLKLQVDGYAVTLFTTAQGSKSWASHSPDIIYLDLGSLGPAGVTAHRRLRAEPRTAHVPVLLLSDRSARQKVVSRLKLGIQDFLLTSDSVPPEAFWHELAYASDARQGNALI